jgi:DNA-binding NtrC family response regulator
MSENELPRILVIDAEGTASPVLDEIKATGRYQFTYAADPQTVPTFLRWKPDVVLLHIPAEKQAAEEALAWLRTIKDQVPVVVISTAVEMSSYLVAMTSGAFDYFTSYTPTPEIIRVLNTAIRWRQAQAA